MTLHVASRNKGSRIDGRTTNKPGYGISQRRRKRVEEPFGWMKTFGLLRKLRHRGESKVDWLFRFTATAYNNYSITRTDGMNKGSQKSYIRAQDEIADDPSPRPMLISSYRPAARSSAAHPYGVRSLITDGDPGESTQISTGC